MAVVRREGDWRLEKRADGAYDITYQKEPQLKVVTPEYSPGMVNEPLLDTLPVREVDNFSAVEAVFEETAQGGPPVGLMGGSGQTASVGTNLGEIELGNGGEGEVEEFPDLPPGGIALVLIIAGGLRSAPPTLPPPPQYFSSAW